MSPSKKRRVARVGAVFSWPWWGNRDVASFFIDKDILKLRLRRNGTKILPQTSPEVSKSSIFPHGFRKNKPDVCDTASARLCLEGSDYAANQRSTKAQDRNRDRSRSPAPLGKWCPEKEKYPMSLSPLERSFRCFQALAGATKVEEEAYGCLGRHAATKKMQRK